LQLKGTLRGLRVSPMKQAHHDVCGIAINADASAENKPDAKRCEHCV
jgi:hypothetical protein